MKTTLFSIMFAMIVACTFASCNCGSTCKDKSADSTIVDTIAADSAVADTVIAQVDSIAE